MDESYILVQQLPLALHKLGSNKGMRYVGVIQSLFLIGHQPISEWCVGWVIMIKE